MIKNNREYVEKPTGYAIIEVLSCPIWQQKGGALMASILSFIFSVMANVASHYICKWLDREDSDN